MTLQVDAEAAAAAALVAEIGLCVLVYSVFCILASFFFPQIYYVYLIGTLPNINLNAPSRRLSSRFLLYRGVFDTTILPLDCHYGFFSLAASIRIFLQLFAQETLSPSAGMTLWTNMKTMNLSSSSKLQHDI